MFFNSPLGAGGMIEVNNVKKSFADKVVIQDVSATMKAGQCNLIIGSSGSGKTVLMKCMVGIPACFSGASSRTPTDSPSTNSVAM